MNPSVLLVGKPNSGKSLLFNRLTGLQQKVSNFPGATVEVRSGNANGLTIVDHPGIYSLQAITSDEAVSVHELKRAVAQPHVKAVICVLDITRLTQSLALGLRLKTLVSEHQKPIVFALNMIDEVKGQQYTLAVEALQSQLGCTVVAISAKTCQGLEQLKDMIHQEVHRGQPSIALPMAQGIHNESETVDPDNISTFTQADVLAQPFQQQVQHLIDRQTRFDRFFLHSWSGGVVFLTIMLVLFQAIFTWAAPLMESVEWGVGEVGQLVTSFIPSGLLHNFVQDAIFNGVGAFLVFVPQIFVLTFIIGLLEDSGYLARAAIICHRPLSLFGLTGKSFVPYLSGHACAIPAILAARTIDSPRRRLLTILTIPLVACSARLPVYSLLIATLIPPFFFVGNVIGLQGLVFFCLYLFGILMALLVSAFLSKLVLRDDNDLPFILELPPYRLPHWRPLFYRSFSSTWTFIQCAGWIILLVTVVVWILGYFPYGQNQLHHSWLATIGQAMEPLFQTLGLDWKFGVAILSSFIAREVFVGTLGTLYGLEESGESLLGLTTKLQESNLTLASGLALLTFYAIALQCISTVAVIKKETGQAWWGIGITIAYGLTAYAAALVVFSVANWLCV